MEERGGLGVGWEEGMGRKGWGGEEERREEMSEERTDEGERGWEGEEEGGRERGREGERDR